MRTLRVAFVSGFAGTLMAERRDGSHAHRADQRGKHEIKGCRQFDPGPWGGWRAAAASVRRVLCGAMAPRMNICRDRRASVI